MKTRILLALALILVLVVASSASMAAKGAKEMPDDLALRRADCSHDFRRPLLARVIRGGVACDAHGWRKLGCVCSLALNAQTPAIFEQQQIELGAAVRTP